MMTKLTDDLSATIPTSIQTAEHAVLTWFHAPEDGTPLEAVLQPAYWTHVAKRLRVGGEIKVMAADGSYWAHLLIVSVTTHAARVAVIAKLELRAAPLPEVDTGYDVKFRGPRRWSVVRKADGQVMAEDMGEKSEADRWLSGHLKAMAA